MRRLRRHRGDRRRSVDGDVRRRRLGGDEGSEVRSGKRTESQRGREGGRERDGGGRGGQRRRGGLGNIAGAEAGRITPVMLMTLVRSSRWRWRRRRVVAAIGVVIVSDDARGSRRGSRRQEPIGKLAQQKPPKFPPSTLLSVTDADVVPSVRRRRRRRGAFADADRPDDDVVAAVSGATAAAVAIVDDNVARAQMIIAVDNEAGIVLKVGQHAAKFVEIKGRGRPPFRRSTLMMMMMMMVMMM